MDLSKAKIVIIALLLAFNAFLLYNNLSYFNANGVQKGDDRQRRSDIESTRRYGGVWHS